MYGASRVHGVGVPGEEPVGLEHLVEEQVERWERRKRGRPEGRRGPVVALSWQAGSLGRELGRAVADRLELDLQDEQILRAIARETHTTERIVRTLDDRSQSFLEEWLLSAEGLEGLGSSEFGRQLARVVRTIEHHGDAVILGHGAASLVDPKRSLRVRVVSPLDVRVQRVQQAMRQTAPEGAAEPTADAAAHEVRQHDADHRAFLRQYFGVAEESPERFDLVLNDARLPLDTLVSLVCAAVESDRHEVAGAVAA